MLTYLDVVTSNAQTWMKKATQHHQLVYCISIFITIVEMKGDATEAEIEKKF